MTKKNDSQIKVTHIGKTICIVENEKDGEYTLLHSSFDSYMEYKEPVIHTRYVHWYKNNLTGGVWADFTKEPPPTRFFNNSLIKTDIVTYEDKS